MNILSWLAIGLIAGVVANVIDPAPSRGGLVGALVLGVLGALVGGFIANLIFQVSITGFDWNSLIIATLGALLLLFIGRAIRRA